MRGVRNAGAIRPAELGPPRLGGKAVSHGEYKGDDTEELFHGPGVCGERPNTQEPPGSGNVMGLIRLRLPPCDAENLKSRIAMFGFSGLLVPFPKSSGGQSIP